MHHLPIGTFEVELILVNIVTISCCKLSMFMASVPNVSITKSCCYQHKIFSNAKLNLIMSVRFWKCSLLMLNLLPK